MSPSGFVPPEGGLKKCVDAPVSVDYTGLMTKIIDGPEALSLLKRAVAEKGAEYVYPDAERDVDSRQCNYFVGGKPSCIVGYAMSYVGIGQEDLTKPFFNAADVNTFIGQEVFFTENATRVFSAAQTIQDREPDSGYEDEDRNWGLAVQEAETWLA